MVNDNIAGAFLCNDMDLQIVEERLGIEPCTHRPDGLFRQWLSPHQIKKTRLKNCASTFSTVFFHYWLSPRVLPLYRLALSRVLIDLRSISSLAFATSN